MNDLAAAQQALGIRFEDTSLLREALVHGSFSNENPETAPVPNERLEFLGDAVLGLVVASLLFDSFPDLNEGEMTKQRAQLVRGDTLARVAGQFDLGRYLFLGRGEDASGGRDKPANLARALEAVIGATFLDRGLEAARGLILRLLEDDLARLVAPGSVGDYKSELQELLQAREQRAPSYHIVSVAGPDHERSFTVEVRLGDAVLGTGTGRSKKAAETEAAQAVLERLHTDFTH